ncbi:AMP-binding protein [Limibacter armeniacum]|uniref:class I adenylate-forming enzyme family protein n=1 Tax=Limibacter armeniacum TaxID=466084 RepID=UPI002FE524BE
MVTKDWSSKWATFSGNKVAVREADSKREITYSDLDRRSRLLALALQRKGLKKGDRVAVLAEFCLEYVLLFAVAQKIGIILVPLNYRLSGRELNYMLENSKPALVITDFAYQHLVEIQPDYQSVPLKLLIQDLPNLEDDFQQWGNELVKADISDADPVFILYTSGTTGFPKGAIYTHGMMFWNSVNTQLRLALTSEDHTVVCMPPFHTGGWNVLLTPLLMHGATITLMPKFDADNILSELEGQQATIFMAVPTMLKMMADSPLFDQVKLEALRYFVVGGEAMPIPLIEKWATKNIPVRQGFGLTETGPNITSLHQDDAIRKKGSIGIPNFYVEIMLADEQGKEVMEGEVGELLIRGPIVTPGYWQNEEATAKSFFGEWFRTGDLLKQDREGFLFVMDRIKHMYISGGENVYPAEVEHIFREIEGIKEVAIVGVPDKKWGETGLAFVVRNKELNVEDVLKACKGKLAKFKLPKHIHFVEYLPKGDTGKLDRKQLKQMALEQLAELENV